MKFMNIRLTLGKMAKIPNFPTGYSCPIKGEEEKIIEKYKQKR
uniref:Uncharacterized protein n=1 Tax=Nelumbo nucifera TaxID=4432 RepID=A0A822Y7X7_NELNU|nr:TPA_asm: hypothetical protein HUJ06_028784 [Nelumbo nucifera]